MTAIPVNQATIEAPDWMDPQYDYRVKWNKFTNEWEVVPF